MLFMHFFSFFFYDEKFQFLEIIQKIIKFSVFMLTLSSFNHFRIHLCINGSFRFFEKINIEK